MTRGTFRTISDLPPVIPVFPLSGVLMLPHSQLPLNIFEPRYLNMFDDAMANHRVIGMIQTVPGGDRTRPELVKVGCLGRINRFSETSDGRYEIILTGLCRFHIAEELSVLTPYRQVRAEYLSYEDDFLPLEDRADFDRPKFLAVLKGFLDHQGLEIDWDGAEAAPSEPLVTSLAAALPFSPAERQALLEAFSPADRREVLMALMQINAAEPRGDDDAPTSLQ
jgi:Lon protease-like protein